MMTRRSLFLMFPILLIVSGCSDLILRDSDSAGQTTGKVMARILLCPITVCFSELSLAVDQRDEERAAKEAAHWRWVRSLPPEQQAREYALEEARIRAAGQALLGLGIGGGIIKPPPPMPVYQPTPAPILQPTMPRSCTSQHMGQTTYTNCY